MKQESEAEIRSNIRAEISGPKSGCLLLLPTYETWDVTVNESGERTVLAHAEGRLPFRTCGETLDITATTRPVSDATDQK